MVADDADIIDSKLLMIGFIDFGVNRFVGSSLHIPGDICCDRQILLGVDGAVLSRKPLGESLIDENTSGGDRIPLTSELESS